jgi:GT2 family glycosyltransferase
VLVSAVIPTIGRIEYIRVTLDRLSSLPIDEIIVVDNGSSEELVAELEDRPEIKLLRPGANLGLAARNLAAEHARNEFLLMLDDDSWPLPGAIEAGLAAFEGLPRLAVVGGLVRDLDLDGNVVQVDEPGSFDWFLRAGQTGDPPPGGFPAFFFPACAAFVRRSAFLEVGGFLRPLFMHNIEVELTTRLLGAGWDVRYLPTAVFEHMKAPLGVTRNPAMAKYRVRNHVWYFWMHFPPGLAARRVPAYLLFDLIEYAYRRNPSAWVEGVQTAWKDRETVRPYRRPLPREILRRAELNRGRMHLRLLWAQLSRNLSRPGPDRNRAGPAS